MSERALCERLDAAHLEAMWAIEKLAAARDEAYLWLIETGPGEIPQLGD